jgi:hypothetical protein
MHNKSSPGTPPGEVSADVNDKTFDRTFAFESQRANLLEENSVGTPKAVAKSSDKGSDSSYKREMPMIGDGVLNENFNKRSEASNRKYRAFLHFLKYEK